MNYLEAKTQLQKSPPLVSFTHLAIEATVLIAVAAILVSLFA